jgi:hydroxymethylbilane synthase
MGFLRSLNDPGTRAAVLAERAMLRKLGGGCHVPIAARGVVQNGQLSLRGIVLSPNGKNRIAAEGQAPMDICESLGIKLASDLLGQGAQNLLNNGAN